MEVGTVDLIGRPTYIDLEICPQYMVKCKRMTRGVLSLVLSLLSIELNTPRVLE